MDDLRRGGRSSRRIAGPDLIERLDDLRPGILIEARAVEKESCKSHIGLPVESDVVDIRPFVPTHGLLKYFWQGCLDPNIPIFPAKALEIFGWNVSGDVDVTDPGVQDISDISVDILEHQIRPTIWQGPSDTILDQHHAIRKTGPIECNSPLRGRWPIKAFHTGYFDYHLKRAVDGPRVGACPISDDDAGLVDEIISMLSEQDPARICRCDGGAFSRSWK